MLTSSKERVEKHNCKYHTTTWDFLILPGKNTEGHEEKNVIVSNMGRFQHEGKVNY